MKSKKIKWLMYTVLIGLIPCISRLLIWTITKENTLELVSAADFISFGLVLHISNINEIEHWDADPDWKTFQNATSILFITVYSILFCSTLIGSGQVDQQTIKTCALVLTVISTMLSYTVFDRVSKAPSFQSKVTP